MKTAPKAAEFWFGGGEAAWKPTKPVLVGKLEEQGSSVIYSKPCYRVLTGTRARIWVNAKTSHHKVTKKNVVNFTSFLCLSSKGLRIA